MKETVLKVAEYSNIGQKKMARIVLIYFILGIVALVIHTALEFIELEGSFWTGFLDGATIGMAIGAMILGILFLTGKMAKIRAFKMRVLGRED